MLSDELYVCLILTAPLYAAFTAMLFPVGRFAVAGAGAVWLGAATVFLLQIDPQPSVLPIGSWLGSSVDPALSVRLQFQFDTTTAIALGTAGVMIILASSFVQRSASVTAERSEPPGPNPGNERVDRTACAVPLLELQSEAAPKLLFLIFLSGVACLSNDLTVVAVSWLLLDVTLARHLAHGGTQPKSGPLKPLQVSSLLLLVVLAVAISRHGTTQLGDIYHKAVSDRQVDAASARAMMGMLVALAIGFRAAMLPGVLWLRRTFESARPVDLVVIPIATLIPAAALVMRLGYVVRVDAQPVLLCAGFAAAAAAIAGSFAVAQRKPTATVLLVQSAMFAHAAAMFCSRQPVPAWPLHFAQVATTAGFGFAFLSANRVGWQRKLTLAFLVLALAGFFYGEPFAIDSRWKWEHAAQLQTFVRAALAITQLLLPVALIRCLSHESRCEDGPSIPLVASLPLLAGFIGVTLIYFGRKSGVQMIQANPWPIAGAAIGTLVVLNRERIANALAPAQPAIQFLEECGDASLLCEWLFALPVRLVSKTVEAFDRHLMGGSKEGAWLAHYRNLAGHVTQLRDLDPRYTALAAVLCLAGLLLALTGTGS